jgi:hypothetical protein
VRGEEVRGDEEVRDEEMRRRTEAVEPINGSDL